MAGLGGSPGAPFGGQGTPGAPGPGGTGFVGQSLGMSGYGALGGPGTPGGQGGPGMGGTGGVGGFGSPGTPGGGVGGFAGQAGVGMGGQGLGMSGSQGGLGMSGLGGPGLSGLGMSGQGAFGGFGSQGMPSPGGMGGFAAQGLGMSGFGGGGFRCQNCGNNVDVRSLQQQIERLTRERDQQSQVVNTLQVQANETVEQHRKRLEELDKLYQNEKSARQELEQRVRSAKNERFQQYEEEIAGLRRQLSTQDRGESAVLAEKRQYLARISELEEARGRHNDEVLQLSGEVQRLRETEKRLEFENAQLINQGQELREDLELVEADAARLEATNKALQQVVDEKEVQVAAMQLYEVEFDRTFSQRLDERERALAEAKHGEEKLMVKVKELQQELGDIRQLGGSPVGGQGNVQELSMLLQEKQLVLEDMEDRNEELEEELGRVRQELESLRAHAPTRPDAGIAAPQILTDQQRDQTVSEYEKRLAAFKTDAIEKDQRVIDLEKKLDEFARGMGAEAMLMQNRQFERQVQDMKRQVGDSKRDLSQFLSEAASIVYENDLLRSYLGKTPDQLDLKEFKLKEKISSAKAVALQKQLEREVAELEDERVKLKRRVRQMSELAAEKVSLLHDLQPEQMLQLEEIAASMRRGKLELPPTDQTRELKKEKEELEKRLKEKDRQMADHIDFRVDELLKKTGAAKEIETKMAALEQENAGLKAMNEALQKGTLQKFEQMALTTAQQAAQSALGSVGPGQMSPEFEQQLQAQFALLEQQAQAQAQMQAQMQGLQGTIQAVQPAPKAPGDDKAVGPSVPPTPAVGMSGAVFPKSMPSTVPPSPAAASSFLGFPGFAGFGGRLMPGMKQPGRPPTGPMSMPQIPGLQPVAWSPLLQAAVQLPRELTEATPENMCCLYCQVVEALEELKREKELRKSLADEVEVFSQKYDRLLADQEVLYKDYFRQRAKWSEEDKRNKDIIRLQGDDLGDTRRKLDDQQRQNETLQKMIKNSAASGSPEGEWKVKLMDAMARIASLEHNESVLSRKYESAKAEHSLVKHAFENLEKDFTERERFLRERLSKTVLWKKRTANALRIARKRLQSMVPTTDFERVQQELQVSKRRELDLVRRQSELTLANAHKEDRLREMGDLQDKCGHLDNMVRETEQEYTVMRQRLQAHEPQFATECALFSKLAALVQQTLGMVGYWDAVARALAFGPGGSLEGAGAEAAGHVQPQSIEVLFDEKLRKLDTNNDGFITLGDVVNVFANLGIKVEDKDVGVLAEALHVVAPMQSTSAAPATAPAAAPGAAAAAPAAPGAAAVGAAVAAPLASVSALTTMGIDTLKKATVSVLAIVGRLRLFGLRPLESEELFWSAVQAALMRRQLDSRKMLQTAFQPLRTPEGYIRVQDVLSVLANFDVAAQRLPTRSLRRVLAWLGVDQRTLDQEAPQENWPQPGDVRDIELRQRMERLCLIYHDFAERFEKSTHRAAQILNPSEAIAAPTAVTAPTAATALSASAATVSSVATATAAAAMPGQTSAALQSYVTEAREAAANRRCVILEQEVRTKVKTVKELQRQVSELEALSQRLEVELHEERGRCVELKARLDGMVPRIEVEPKLKKLEELSFEVQQSRLALQQSKDMTRVCATQAENYEQLVKRRQLEVRHLQETVQMLQGKDEVANTVGKIQYRLLLSQWEKSNLQRQLEAATRELRQARTQLLENEEEIEKEKHTHEQEEESLQHRLTDARDLTEKYKEQATGSLPIDKARELTAKIEQIASKKTELEEKLVAARRQLHRNQTETEELKLRAEQAKQLMDEVTASEAGSEAPRQRLIDMAKKLADSKLLELRHKRDLEISKEQTEHLEQSRLSDAKEIEKLQKEVAQAEAKLIAEEERWREKILEVQQSMLAAGVRPDGSATGSPGTQARRLSIRRTSRGDIMNIEQISDRLNEKDAKINELEAEIEKIKAEQERIVADERMRNRKLELELNLVNQGDAVKLRQQLHAEHEAEMKQISEAAQESVSTLQALLDQSDARIRQREEEMQNVLQAKKTDAEQHMRDQQKLQEEILNLRKDLNKARHEPPHFLASVPPTPHAGTVDLNASFGDASVLDDVPMLEVGNRLEAGREQLQSMEAQMKAQQEEWRNMLQVQQQDAQNREKGLLEEFQAREQMLEQQFRAREQQVQAHEQKMQQRIELLEGELHKVTGKSNKEIEAAVEEGRWHQQQAAHHAANHARSVDEHRQAVDTLQAQNRQLQAELDAETEKNRQSTVRKQQAALRKQIAGKEEQLSTFRKAVEELKDKVVQLTVDRDKDLAQHQGALKAEADMRRRLEKQEERVRGLNDHVAKLTKQLQEQTEQGEHAIKRSAEFNKVDKELEKMLDEACARLAERSDEARFAEQRAARQEERADRAEQALSQERLVLQGEVRAAQQDSRASAEANARRLATLHERIDKVLAERDELAARLSTHDVTSERLRSEQRLREQLQTQVSELAAELEAARGEKVRLLKSSPSPLRESVSRLEASVQASLVEPLSPRGQGRPSSPPGGRSPSPLSSVQPNHLIAKTAQLTAKNSQLQAEVAACKSKIAGLQEDNDDLRLKLAAGHPGPDPREFQHLRMSADSISVQSRNLMVELESQRAKTQVLDEQNRNYLSQVQLWQQRFADVSQQLEVNRGRMQSLEAERITGASGRYGSPPPLPGGFDATALAAAQNKVSELQAKLESLMTENVQLRRDGSGAFPASGMSAQQMGELQARLADRQARVDVLEQENQRLRQFVPADQANTMAMAGHLDQMKSTVEQLMRENVDLRRSASASDPSASLAAARQIESLQAKVDELMRENVQLRRNSSPSGLVPGDSGQHLRDQAIIQELMQENVELRRNSPGNPGTGGYPGGYPGGSPGGYPGTGLEAAELAAARRQVSDLKARIDQLLKENVELQRRISEGASGTGGGHSGTFGLGVLGDTGELGQLRRLNDENRAQRKALELVLTRVAMDGDAGAAFKPLMEECQQLDRRVVALSDENVVLRLRLAESSSSTGPDGGLPPIPLPGSSLEEAREANLLMRQRHDAIAAEHAASVRRLQEVAKRVDQLVGENVELQAQLRRSTFAGSAAAGSPAEVEEHRRVRERAEKALEEAERGRRAATEQLRSQTARVAEMDADRAALRQQVHEARVREFAAARQLRPGAAPGGALQSAEEASNRQYLLARVEALENENEQLRRWAERTDSKTPEKSRDGKVELAADHAALQDRFSRLATENRKLSKEIQELKHVAATQEPQDPRCEQMLEDMRGLRKRLADADKENASLKERAHESAQKRMSLLETVKCRVEESGVTILQMLRALDVKKDGLLDFNSIEGVIRKLPLQLPAGGALSAALAESTKAFLAVKSDLIRYVDWLEHLTAVPLAHALAAQKGLKYSPRTASLRNAETMGVVDETQQLRGFSLRAGFDAVDKDGDGMISRSALTHAFGAFFEFLSPEEVQTLVRIVQPESGDGSIISWIDCVWKLDVAFIASRGHVDALQALQNTATKLAKGGEDLASVNPFDSIKEYVKKCERKGEKGVLRRIFNAFDPRRIGFITKRAFKRLLRDEAGVTSHSDEELDFLFKAVDQDGDDAISFHDFEHAITGDNRQKQITDLLLKFGKAIVREGITLKDLIKMFDYDHSGQLDRSEFARMLDRLNYRVNEAEFDMLMDEFDIDASGAIDLPEFKRRMDQARCEDLIAEFKHALRRLSISPLDAFIEADVDGSGNVTFQEFQAIFSDKYRINLIRGQLRELFHLCDEDGSGAISYREFLRTCGLRCSVEDDEVSREYLPRGDGQAWAEDCLKAIKAAIIRAKRDEEDVSSAARQAFMQVDQRGSGALTAAQFRHAISNLGIDADQQDAERLCEILRRGARSGAGRGGQQGQGQRRGSAAGREVRIDTILARLEAVYINDEENARNRLEARPVAKVLANGLRRRSLSLVAMLADLDPAQHGTVVFDAFRVAASRHHLGLGAQELQILKVALKPNERGMFRSSDLLKLVQAADEGEGTSPGGASRSVGSEIGGEALEGLPPPVAVGAASAAFRRRGRSTGAVEQRAASGQHPEREMGNVEARHRRQIDALNHSLKQAESDRNRLQREVNEMRREAAENAAKAEKAADLRDKKPHPPPQTLKVLLAQSDAAATVKELKLEVQGTHELRSKLFAAETELEDARRKLHVDSRMDLEREQQKVSHLQRELEERERVIEHLNFDLRRARAAAGPDAAEEEYMSLNLQNRRLEDELSARKKSEAEFSDKLLEQEHMTMELRFEREQARTRALRLENRLLELELLVDGDGSRAPPTAKSSTPASRKERGLEQVIEGLERVIAQQKSENKKLKEEVEGKRDDRRHKAEVGRLRKKIESLETELGSNDRKARQMGQQVQRGSQEVDRARSVHSAMQADLEQKESQIGALQQQLRDVQAQAARGSFSSPAGPDAERLQRELRELQAAHQADVAALDEAGRALHEAELTERRYLEVAKENKRLRAEMGALEDEGFWREIEELQKRNDEGSELLRESKEALHGVYSAFPSLEPPSGLLDRISRFVTAAAAAA